jgi:RNA binding exosome subunit
VEPTRLQAQNVVAYIDIRAFSHATEDEARVMEAVKKILPSAHADMKVFEKRVLSGHHGNPIILFDARLKDKEMLKALVEKIAMHLNALDKETLSKRLGDYSEKGSLYLRLDKQAAFEDEFKLAQTDPIRIHIRFKRRDIAEICRELGLIS